MKKCLKRLSAAGLASIGLMISIPSLALDQIQYLARPQEGLAAFLTLPAQAQSSIDIATFIFEPCDASTRILMETLARKARSGVRVRVFLDSITQSHAQKVALAQAFNEAGIKLRFFNRWELNLRSHIKLMVIDGKKYITGGRNISDEYFALSSDFNFTDRDVLITGDTANQAVLSFQELWDGRLSTSFDPYGPFEGWTRFCRHEASPRMAEVQRYLDHQAAIVLQSIPTRTCANVKFMTDHVDYADLRYGNVESSDYENYMSAARLERKRVSRYIVSFVAGARQRLRMENWAYMPVAQMAQAFADLRAQHVNVEVITNQDIDGRPAIYRQAMEYSIQVAATRDTKGSQTVGRISSRGSHTGDFELSPKNVQLFVHSKVGVSDGRDVVVGSANLDPRSYNINLESTVGVNDCPELAADLDTRFQLLQQDHARDVREHLGTPMEYISFAAKLVALLTYWLL